MRRGLRWALGLTLGLTALAWWTSPDNGPVSVVAAIDRASAGPSGPRMPLPPLAEGDVPPLPERLTERHLEPARADIFVRALVQAAPPAAPAPEPPPLPVAEPAAPPMNYRFLGRMTDPNGREQIYLVHEDRSVAVSPGDTLSDGYLVKSVSAQEIVLTHPPTATEVAISIPAPQGE